MNHKNNALKKIMRDSSGSFTVEATVIVSFLLLIFLTFILLSFFVYNRTIIENAVLSSALRGSEQIWDSNEKQVDVVNDGLIEILSGHTIGTTQIEKNIKCKGSTVKVSANWNYYKWSGVCSCEKNVINPVKFVRYCRKKNLIQK